MRIQYLGKLTNSQPGGKVNRIDTVDALRISSSNGIFYIPWFFLSAQYLLARKNRIGCSTNRFRFRRIN